MSATISGTMMPRQDAVIPSNTCTASTKAGSEIVANSSARINSAANAASRNGRRPQICAWWPTQGDTAATISTTASQAGLPKSRGAYVLTDLWTNRGTESAGTVTAHVPAHGTVLYRVRATGNWDAYPPATAVSPSIAPAYPGGPAVAQPGTANSVTTMFTNTGRVPAENVSVSLGAPVGWTVRPQSPASDA